MEGCSVHAIEFQSVQRGVVSGEALEARHALLALGGGIERAWRRLHVAIMPLVIHAAVALWDIRVEEPAAEHPSRPLRPAQRRNYLRFLSTLGKAVVLWLVLT